MKFLTGFICLIFILSGQNVFSQDKQISPDLDLLVKTEIEFAKTSVEKGSNIAFLKFFDDTGLIFPAKLVLVKEAFASEAAAKNSLRFKVNWQPVYGDISNAGDFGYMTGVSERTDNQNPSVPARYGAFFSFWKKQSDGIWKVLLDCGVRTPQPIAALDASFTAPTSRGSKQKFYKADDSEIPKIESKFLQDLQKKGLVKTYLNNIDEYSRIHRMGEMPQIGVFMVRDFLTSHPMNLRFTASKTGISKSGDLGFVYGEYEATKPNGQNPPSEKGVFLRVWQRDAKGKWKIVVDILKGSTE